MTYNVGSKVLHQPHQKVLRTVLPMELLRPSPPRFPSPFSPVRPAAWQRLACPLQLPSLYPSRAFLPRSR